MFKHNFIDDNRQNTINYSYTTVLKDDDVDSVPNIGLDYYDDDDDDDDD